MPTNLSYLEELAGVLKEVVQKMTARTGKINFTGDPKIERRDIIEYQRRMRVSGLEKFNKPAYVSGVSYFRTSKDQEEHKSCGALVLYIEEEFMETLLKALGHTTIDEDTEEALAKKCGEFCLTLAEQFKNEISSQGYNGLVSSEPVSFRNSIPLGLDFSYDQYDKYEVSFSIKNFRVLVAEVTMGGRK